MNYTKQNIDEINKLGIQKASLKFCWIVEEIIEDKTDFKGQKLDNGMSITGIGTKCLKVENNFYDWEDIEYYTLDADTDDPVMQSIVRFFFTGKYEEEEKDSYTARKFTREEYLANPEQIQKEIIEHKEYYKTGEITGIGTKSIMIGQDYDAAFVQWDTITRRLKESSVADFLLGHRQYDLTIVYDDERTIIDEFFIKEDDEKEEQLLHDGVDYAVEKAYIYRHIIQEDLTVEDIRAVVYRNYGDKGQKECETIVKHLLGYAFQYIDEIPVTIRYDDKYFIKNKDGYFECIKNREVVYDEEEEAFKFKKIGEIRITVENKKLVIYRDGKRAGEVHPAHKPVYIKTRGRFYELSVEVQLEILSHYLPSMRKPSSDEIKEEFLSFLTGDSELAYIINDAIMKHHMKNKNLTIEEVYNNSIILQGIARMLYQEEGVFQPTIESVLNALIAEPYIHYDLLDVYAWDDSNEKKAEIYHDKYHLNTTGKHITIDLEQYTYTQNTKYTLISNTTVDIDTFAVTDCYYEGVINEEEIPIYYNYAWGVYVLQGTWKHGWINTKTLPSGGKLVHKW